MSSFHPWRAAGALAYLPVAAGLFLLAGCPGETPTPNKGQKSGSATAGRAGHDADHEDDHDHDEGHHHHHAEKGPHGGTLIAIGDDDAHLEIVLDSEAGKLTAYVLDGEAEKPVPIKQSNLQFGITVTSKEHDDEEHAGEKEDHDPLSSPLFPLMLKAVDPQEGMASEFAGEADELKGAERFNAALTTINVGGKVFKEVTFPFPEGNEHHH